MVIIENIIKKLNSAPMAQYFMMTLNLKAVSDATNEPGGAFAEEIKKAILRLCNVSSTVQSEAEDEFNLLYDPMQRSPMSFFPVTGNLFIVIFDMNPYNSIGQIAEFKIRVMSVISKYFPAAVNNVNQRRLFHVIDVARAREEAQNRLRRIQEILTANRPTPNHHLPTAESTPEAAATAAAVAERNTPDPQKTILALEHIPFVADGLKGIGPEMFFDLMITSQRLAYFDTTERLQVFAAEWYTSMSNIQRFLLPNVYSWGNASVFSELTAVMDRFFLRSLCYKGDFLNQTAAININVQSLTSPEFARFEDMFGARFRNLILEFRLFDIVANLDGFFSQVDRLTSNGATICIDWMDPARLGLIDIGRLKAKMIKFDAGSFVDSNSRDLPALGDAQQAGCMAAFMHCDKDDQIQLGRELGIRVFQGHEIDRRLWTLNGDATSGAVNTLSSVRETIRVWTIYLRTFRNQLSAQVRERAAIDLKTCHDTLTLLRNQVEKAAEVRLIDLLFGRIKELEDMLSARQAQLEARVGAGAGAP